MKNLLLVIGLITLSYSSVIGQKKNIEQITNALDKVNSIEDAENLLSQDTTLTGEIISLNTRTDTTYFAKEMFTKKKGDIVDFSDNEFIYVTKAIAWRNVNQYRVSYIYLDNNIYTINEIDSLRKLINKKLKAGVKFSDLALTYSMDGNSKKGGDIGWFQEGQMIKIFEDSIKTHSLGDIYYVDVPENKWYYIVKNTYNPIQDKILDVILIRQENIK